MQYTFPNQTALMIIDMQNDLCVRGAPSGPYSGMLPNLDKIVSNIEKLSSAARNAGVSVVYTKAITYKNRGSASLVYIRNMMKVHKVVSPKDIPEQVVDGTYGCEVVKEISPRDGDIIVRKHRPSAFIGTDLDLILRFRGIRTLVVTGVVTEGCVENTIRDAYCLDYFVVVARDAVGSANQRFHEHSLEYFESRYDVVNTSELLDMWKQQQILP